MDSQSHRLRKSEVKMFNAYPPLKRNSNVFPFRIVHSAQLILFFKKQLTRRVFNREAAPFLFLLQQGHARSVPFLIATGPQNQPLLKRTSGSDTGCSGIVQLLSPQQSVRLLGRKYFIGPSSLLNWVFLRFNSGSCLRF
ncbi:hypothetical protein TNIN_192601 [Trichonephila inaurata madagascariensis]|uniref:Uncharacterized protein n=1 Tax=Trichonephila inaurata madagascariensis TaxID=2747483 RepID=A0A8X6YWI4_9ARAC|nr:hypothetical protein TNIN_192601 [Trichonephila inaurata madagascariensis]